MRYGISSEIEESRKPRIVARSSNRDAVMLVCFSRINPDTHRLWVLRPGFPDIDVSLETRSMLLHDFVHYAAEAEMGTEAGFYGHLASGWSLERLRDETLGMNTYAEMMAIEATVGRLQGAFSKGRAIGHPAEGRLRAVWGAWCKTRQFEQLELEWPPRFPVRVVERSERSYRK
ncbi:MAG: hypothetical protein AAF219_07220 [Myxococcota bacterium]